MVFPSDHLNLYKGVTWGEWKSYDVKKVKFNVNQLKIKLFQIINTYLIFLFSRDYYIEIKHVLYD